MTYCLQLILLSILISCPTECEKDGLNWGAGYVAFRCKHIQPELGAYDSETTSAHTKNKNTTMLNRGVGKKGKGARVVTIQWEKDFIKMNEIFIDHHPTGGLRSGRGLHRRYYLRLLDY